jgi:hypothetical protein
MGIIGEKKAKASSPVLGSWPTTEKRLSKVRDEKQSSARTVEKALEVE